MAHPDVSNGCVQWHSRRPLRPLSPGHLLAQVGSDGLVPLSGGVLVDERRTGRAVPDARHQLLGRHPGHPGHDGCGVVAEVVQVEAGRRARGRHRSPPVARQGGPAQWGAARAGEHRARRSRAGEGGEQARRTAGTGLAAPQRAGQRTSKTGAETLRHGCPGSRPSTPTRKGIGEKRHNAPRLANLLTPRLQWEIDRGEEAEVKRTRSPNGAGQGEAWEGPAPGADVMGPARSCFSGRRCLSSDRDWRLCAWSRCRPWLGGGRRCRRGNDSRGSSSRRCCHEAPGRQASRPGPGAACGAPGGRRCSPRSSRGTGTSRGSSWPGCRAGNGCPDRPRCLSALPNP